MLEVVSVIRRNPDRSWHGDMLDVLAFVKAQKDRGASVEGDARSFSARPVPAELSPWRYSKQALASSSSTTWSRRGFPPCSS
jgi:hypothetical protein